MAKGNGGSVTTEAPTRYGKPLCLARKRNGDLCMSVAGWGTPHLGSGRCKQHGGNTRAHLRHEAKKEAVRQTATLGLPVDTPPHEALLWAVRTASGHAFWLQQQVAELPDVNSISARYLIALYGEERDRLTRSAKAAMDAGVAERMVRIAEQYGELIARFISGVFDELSLTARQREVAPEIVRRQLLLLESGPPQREAQRMAGAAG